MGFFGWFKKKDKKQQEDQKQPQQQTQQNQAQKKKNVSQEEKSQIEAENVKQIKQQIQIQILKKNLKLKKFWKIPIYDFIDEYCIVFDDEEENKFEYTDIHNKFKKQIEIMVDQLMQDIGINEEQFYQMSLIGLRNKNHRKIFEQILIVDNFLVFKKLMVKRNKELELEALKELEKQDGGKDLSKIQTGEQKKSSKSYEVKQKELEQEKRELDLAIAMSMAVQKEQANMSVKKILYKLIFQTINTSKHLFLTKIIKKTVEDQELEKALLESQLTYKQEQEEKLSKSKLQEQQEKQKQQAESKTDAQLQKETAKPQEQEKEQYKLYQQESKPVQENKQKEEESKEQQQQQQQISPAKNSGQKLSSLGSLPPLKANKNLPPLQSKYQAAPVDDLLKKKEDLEKRLEERRLAEEKIKNAQVQEKSEDQSQSQANTLEERKKKLLAQRELLRKRKQQQREEELKRFQELGQNEPQQQQGEKKSSQDQGLNKQNTVALDLDKQGPSSHISAEDRKKRMDLYSKIKSNIAQEQQQQQQQQEQPDLLSDDDDDLL
ncbi:hypothetical protein PPERSA_07605 [Pseudocohnilembus persalinus]|uniref:Cilia- and flagella-associated protein 36 n=1 Tax=Pseudocohnilembus persalinus TaxID=266149 RepID=A0A0V0QIP1_PSEPJ|nr:hypothetical protein PPERSA_07605 [Pseudocohnilembus persalinus]|eukprot:KRX01960.1 hypothetical protein PPERSA_07605 [Pseudocohnilembus persalinus]